MDHHTFSCLDSWSRIHYSKFVSYFCVTCHAWQRNAQCHMDNNKLHLKNYNSSLCEFIELNSKLLKYVCPPNKFFEGINVLLFFYFLIWNVTYVKCMTKVGALGVQCLWFNYSFETDVVNVYIKKPSYLVPQAMSVLLIIVVQ